MALLLDITIVNPCASSNLKNAARHTGKHLADTVKWEKQISGLVPRYLPFPLAMSTCGEVGLDVHALMKELAIRRVEYRSEIHSNEPQHLAEVAEVADLQRRFSFVLQHAVSFHTRHYLCRQGVALAVTRQLRSQGSVSVHAHCTEGVTGSEGRARANGVGAGIGVGVGNGDGNGVGVGNRDVNGDRDGTEQEQEREWRRTKECKMGTGTGVETRRRTQYGNAGGSGDGNERSSRHGNGDEDKNGDGNENRVGEGRGEAKNPIGIVDARGRLGWKEKNTKT